MMCHFGEIGRWGGEALHYIYGVEWHITSDAPYSVQ